MNSHIEKENILTFGKKSIDVSNVSYGRIVKASTVWNKAVQDENITPEKINKMCDTVGLYLIRQDFSVLRLRFTFLTAIKEYIKRLFLNRYHINKSIKTEYDEFQDWVYFQLTGKKKENLKTEADLMEQTISFYQAMEKKGIKPDKCLELLQTLVLEQASELKTSTNSRKA